MLIEAHAFLSDELFMQTDEKIWGQTANAAMYPTVKGVYLMPDTHMGYHVPIGSVVVTDDVIAQGSVGYDISCGVLLTKLVDVFAEDVVDPAVRLKWVRAVESRIATGLGSHRPDGAPTVDVSSVEELIFHGAEPLGIAADLCERVVLPVPASFDPRKMERAWPKAAPQMGSLGSGNHFVELQVEETTGEVYAQVHCGSRGFGWQIAHHYFYEAARLRGLTSRRREEAWLSVDEPLGKEFLAAHNAAANYAIANRWTIHQGLEQASQEVFGCDLEPVYEISHNLAQRETLPDGTEGIVNRKGATRAFPAGHPQLHNTRWWETGHPCLIPGSMLAGAAVLIPGKSDVSGYSVNHGSGRLLGRGQAKREFKAVHDEIDHEMRTIKRVLGGVEIEGIVINTERTPLDECGHSYKELDDVLGVLTEGGIATVERRMLPVANIKGME